MFWRWGWHSWGAAGMLVAALVGGAVAASGQEAAQPRLVDLHEQAGWEGGSTAWAINAAGHVVGSAYGYGIPPGLELFLLRDGMAQAIGALPIPTDGVNDNLRDVNEAGQIVGYFSSSADSEYPKPRAFLAEDGVVQMIGPQGGRGSAALAINAFGQVVGQAETLDGDWHAFLWDDGELIDLFGKPGNAQDINDHGRVVGEAGDAAVLWAAGVLTELPALSEGQSSADASGINDAGQIVGTVNVDGIEHAVLWDGGTVIDLHPAGATGSRAWAINDAGQIVGNVRWPDALPGARQAVLWDGDRMVELPEESGSHAFDINNNGQIVGSLFVPATSFETSKSHAAMWELR